MPTKKQLDQDIASFLSQRATRTARRAHSTVASGDAWAVAKKFTKAVRDNLTDGQVSALAAKFSPYDAGYKGAMQSQDEGTGWYDEGLKVTPPRGFGETPQISNAVWRAVRRGAKDAGYALPR